MQSRFTEGARFAEMAYRVCSGGWFNAIKSFLVGGAFTRQIKRYITVEMGKASISSRSDRLHGHQPRGSQRGVPTKNYPNQHRK